MCIMTLKRISQPEQHATEPYDTRLHGYIERDLGQIRSESKPHDQWRIGLISDPDSPIDDALHMLYTGPNTQNLITV